MAYLLIVLMLCAILIVPGNSQQQHSNRFGFVGTRGKRSISNDENDIQVVNNEFTTKPTNDLESSPPIILDNNHIEPNENDYNYVISKNIQYYPSSLELGIIKRAPSGFMGMRGKKDYEYSGITNELIGINSFYPRENMLWPKYRRIPLSTFNRIILSNLNPKRGPSGFMGMRGKKQENNFMMDNKRVPMGFTGTRGKKDLIETSDDNNGNDFGNSFTSHQNNLDYNDIDLPSPLVWNMEYDAPLLKRAPSGFLGMRGKKFNTYYNNDYDDDINKRAPSGFLGMRGKKSMYTFNQEYVPGDNDENEILYDTNILGGNLGQIDSEKRKLNGFFGMRGKKDVSSQLLNAEKRSFQQFFGMRGKKQPFNSGFFGMRGKKEPFQFRGKFVGVRGKKSFSPDESLIQLPSSTLLDTKLDSYNSDISTVDKDQELLNSKSDNAILKRGPSGFVGMRGKKGYDYNDESENNQ